MDSVLLTVFFLQGCCVEQTNSKHCHSIPVSLWTGKKTFPNNWTVVKIPIQWWYVWFIHMGSTNPMFPGFDFEAGNHDCCSGHQRGAAEGFKKAPKKMPLRLKNATHRPDMWIKFRSICKYSHSICFFHLLKLHGAFYQTPCNLTYWRIHNANFCGHRSELPSVLIPGERCVLGQWDDPWSGKFCQRALRCTAQLLCNDSWFTLNAFKLSNVNYCYLCYD